LASAEVRALFEKNVVVSRLYGDSDGTLLCPKLAGTTAYAIYKIEPLDLSVNGDWPCFKGFIVGVGIWTPSNPSLRALLAWLTATS